MKLWITVSTSHFDSLSQYCAILMLFTLPAGEISQWECVSRLVTRLISMFVCVYVFVDILLLVNKTCLWLAQDDFRWVTLTVLWTCFIHRSPMPSVLQRSALPIILSPWHVCSLFGNCQFFFNLSLSVDQKTAIGLPCLSVITSVCSASSGEQAITRVGCQ